MLDQADLRLVPGDVGVSVFKNNEAMPVTAQRAAPLPAVRTSTFPGVAEVVASQPVWLRCPGPRPQRPGPARHPLRRVRTSSALCPDHRRPPVTQQPAFGWAAQFGTAKEARNSRCRSSGALSVSVEVSASIVCWRPHGTAAPAAPGAPERVVTRARQPGDTAWSRRRWPVLVVVAASSSAPPSGPRPESSDPSPARRRRRAGRRTRRRVLRLVLHQPNDQFRRGTRFLVPTNATARAVNDTSRRSPTQEPACTQPSRSPRRASSRLRCRCRRRVRGRPKR